MIYLRNFFLLLTALTFLVSCDESNEESEFDNWQQRNEAFIDSIAVVARANVDGDWAVFLYDGLDPEKQWDNENYVYCKKLNDVESTRHPMYTDTVVVDYCGRLIPTKSYPAGFIFDSSYDGELDPSFDVPVKFSVRSTVNGFCTALQRMSAGSRWILYIPAALGYGAENVSGVPAFSTLIFDVNLVSFYPVGTAVPL